MKLTQFRKIIREEVRKTVKQHSINEISMSVVNNLWTEVSKYDNKQMSIIFREFADKFKQLGVKGMQDAFEELADKISNIPFGQD